MTKPALYFNNGKKSNHLRDYIVNKELKHNPPQQRGSNQKKKLQFTNLNVSAEGKFYERAKSRRGRHRLALMEHSDKSIPLGKKTYKKQTKSSSNDILSFMGGETSNNMPDKKFIDGIDDPAAAMLDNIAHKRLINIRASAAAAMRNKNNNNTRRPAAAAATTVNSRVVPTTAAITKKAAVLKQQRRISATLKQNVKRSSMERQSNVGVPLMTGPSKVTPSKLLHHRPKTIKRSWSDSDATTTPKKKKLRISSSLNNASSNHEAKRRSSDTQLGTYSSTPAVAKSTAREKPRPIYYYDEI